MEILAIYDRENGFAERLALMMNEDESFPYCAEVFTSEEALLGEIKAAKVDVLVTDKTVWDEMVQKTGVGRVIVWSDVPGYSCIDGLPAVYKYQSGKQIQKEILNILSEEKAVPVEAGSGRTKYIGVVSPVGRSFKTSFAVTLGQLLSERGRVLYVSLEPYTAYDVFFGKSAEVGFSNLLYVWSIRNEEKNAAGKVNERSDRKEKTEHEAVTMHEKADESTGYGRFVENFHGLFVLPPTEFPEDLYRTDPVQVRMMLSDLVREQDFDLVIIELGMDHRYLDVFLPLMHKVYVPSRDDAVSQCKVQEFMRFVERMDEFSYRRFETIIIPVYPLIPGGVSQAEQILWSGVGDYVRTMLAGMY